jgi:hypothetical protein
MLKGIFLLFLLSFCDSFNHKKQVCINCKLNILKPNKKSNFMNLSYCRANDCIYGRKGNLMKLVDPNPLEYSNIEKQPDTEKQPEKGQEIELGTEIEKEIDQEVKKLCENYDKLIERIEIYKKAKIRKFIKKIYESVNKQLDEHY